MFFTNVLLGILSLFHITDNIANGDKVKKLIDTRFSITPYHFASVYYNKHHSNIQDKLEYKW